MPAVASSRRPPPREAGVGVREEKARGSSGATSLLASSPLLRRKRRIDVAVCNLSSSPDATASESSVRPPLKKQICTSSPAKFAHVGKELTSPVRRSASPPVGLTEGLEASCTTENDVPSQAQPLLPENNRFLLQTQTTWRNEDAGSPPAVLDNLSLASPTRRTNSPRLRGRFPITSCADPRISRGKGSSPNISADSAGETAAKLASLASRIPLFPAFDGEEDEESGGHRDLPSGCNDLAGISSGRNLASLAPCVAHSSPRRDLCSSALARPLSSTYGSVPGGEEKGQSDTFGLNGTRGDSELVSSPLKRARGRPPVNESSDSQDGVSSFAPRRERVRSVSGGLGLGDGFPDSLMPRSGTPPFKGPRSERSDSGVVPSTPPRLPDSFDLPSMSSSSSLSELDRLNLLNSSGASGGDGTPLGAASRRPRESFEFALTDETATPSPFSRSKQRSRSSLVSPAKTSGVDRGGGDALETADAVSGGRGRREGEEDPASSSSSFEQELMLTESPFRRSPLSSKRQCTFSPVKLTPPREAPLFFRVNNSPNKKLTVVDSTPIWLLDDSATSVIDVSQGPSEPGGATGSPADLLFSSLLSSENSCKDNTEKVRNPGNDSNFAAAVVASVPGETLERKVAQVSRVFEAFVGLGLDALLRLPLGSDLERLWSLFRSLRVVCDREHHAGKPLAFHSTVLPALNRLTRTGNHLAASSSILNAQLPERVTSSVRDPVVSSEGRDQQKKSKQLDIEDLGRMVWLAPHLFGWRYRRLSATAVGTHRNTLLTSPVSRRLRPGGDENEGSEPRSPSSPRKGLLLASGEADEVDLELLEFTLPAPGNLPTVFLRAAGGSVAPEVIMVGREPQPAARLTQFRALLVFWTFLWQWHTLRQTRQPSLQAPFLQACWHSLVSKGQWAAGFDPQMTPLPPFRSSPPLPAKPLIRSPGKNSSSGSPSLRRSPVSSSVLSPIRNASLGSRTSPFSSPASRAISSSSSSSLLRRLEASLSSPLSSVGLRNTLRSTAAAGSTSLGSRGASRVSASEGTLPPTPDMFRCRLSSGDRSLSLSSVSVSGIHGGCQTRAAASQIGFDGVSRQPEIEDTSATSPVLGSSKRAASAGLSPISEKLRRKTEERRRARLQQEERRKQRAALHYEERRWANVAWVLGLLLDACVYRDRRSKIDLKTFMSQFVLHSKIPLSTHVVEECLQALVNLSPTAVSFDGSVITLAPSANPETLRQLVDGQVQEAREAIQAFAEESREPGEA